MAGDDRIDRLEMALISALGELHQANIRIASIEAELIAYRTVCGTLVAEITRAAQSQSEALERLSAKLLADAARIAIRDRAMRGAASPVVMKYTEVIEGIIACAEEAGQGYG
jgi:hypothetical protein